MGLFDDLLEEEDTTQPATRRGLFDDLLEEEEATTQPQRPSLQPAQAKEWKLPKSSPFAREPEPPKEGLLRQAADIPVGLAKGAAQGVRSFTDILGADNPVSQSIRGVEGYLGNLMSAQAKKDQAEIARIMQDAEDKGVLDQVMAGVKAFSVAPVDMTVQALGTMAPVIVGGLAANTAKLAATGIRAGVAGARGLTAGQMAATQAGIGAGMGAGVVKGTIYDEVKNELISQGLSEDAAHEQAVKAQEYGGKNLDQILLGAGLGAAAATTGAEKIIGGILTKTGVGASKSRIGNALKAGVTEAFPEAAQGAQEQLAANVALQREGMEVPTMRGVFSSGALEGIAGFGVGAPLGAIQKASVAEDAARKAEEADAPQTANAIRKEAQQTVAAEKAVVQEEQDIEDTEKEMVPIQEEYKVPAKEEFKTTFAKMSPESIAQTEQGFLEELESEDADTRAFAQAGLDALAEFRAGVAPTPITVPPVEKVAPAVAAVTQPAAPVTPAAPAQPVAAPAEPITSADAQVINNLRSVAENTANREQISALSEAGLVDIIKGQPVINEDGEALLAQAQAPLPRLTPEERVAEIQAAAPPAPPVEAPAAPAAAPAIVEQEPTISEKPPTSEMVSPAPAQPAPAQAVAPAPEVAPTEIEAVHFSRTPMKLEKGVDVSKIEGAYEEESTFGRGFYAAEKTDESMWKSMSRFKLGDFRNEVKISPKNPIIISPETIKKLGFDAIKDRIDRGDYDAIISRGWDEETGEKITKRIDELWEPEFENKETSGRFTNFEEYEAARKQAIEEITGLPSDEYEKLDDNYWNQNQIFIPPDIAPDVVSTTPAVSETITPAPTPEAPTEIAVGNRIKLGKSPQTYVVEEVIPQTATERDLGEQYYSVKNERTGEVQVVEKNDVKPVKGKGARRMTGDIRETPERFDPIPVNERATYDQSDAAVRKIFGKNIPENLAIIEEDTNQEYNMRAGYYPDSGMVVLNLAYIGKGENIQDIISHELGHYIYGDNNFKDAFKSFWNAMSPEQQAEADRIIKAGYNKETGAIQMEEKQVRAFMSLIEEANAQPQWRKVLDAIKRWFNRVFGTEFQTTDRGALDVLAAGVKRFGSGEQIIRAEVTERRMAAQTQDARYAELEARARAGDKEAEAEAQRMVDEAAKAAGYGVQAYHGTNAPEFSEFLPSSIFGESWFFSDTPEYPAQRGNRVIKAHLDVGRQKVVKIPTNKPWSVPVYELEIINKSKQEGYDSVRLEAIPPSWMRVLLPLIGLKADVSGYTNATVVFKPEQIKSADPFTYDDAGNLIPLSQRFQPTSPDIRRMAVEAEPTVEAAPAERVTRRTKMQNIIDISTGVKRPRTKLTVDEMAALKDQIRIGARKRREDKQTQKEFAKDVTEYLRGMAIRGKVSAPQLRAITSKAMQTQFDNEASIKGFLNYANKVIENANYNKDISEAKAAIKRARQLADQKKGSPQTKAILAYFGVVDPKEIEPENMDERDVEVDGVIVREKPISVAEFTSVLKEYMKAFAPVTAEGYVVIPDAEMVDFLSKVGAQIKQNQDATKNIGFDGELAEIADKTPKQIEEELARDEERRKRIENKVNKLAEAAQIGLAKYDNPDLNADEKDILDFMKRATLSDMDLGNRKDYIRIANDILVNNKFFGAEKFASIAEGQIGAAEAARDSKTIKRNDALIKGYYQLFGEETGREIALGMQSLSDTLRNITRPEEGVRLLYQMGFGKLERGRAAANSEKRKFTDAMDVRLKQIEKKTGQSINDGQGLVSSGVAATLIQTAPDETQAEGIQRMRGLIEADIERKKNSWRKEDRMTAALVEQALKEVYADSVDGILANLKKTHPANYEVLTFLMDTVLPSYKPLFKQHDEMFNNQTDNYDNPFYLPIKYRRVVTEPVDPAEGIGNRMQSVASPKQSVNSIKRVKNTVLPENMQFDYNLIRNVIDSVASQLDAAYMNPGLQQVHAFLTSENAAKALGGAENLEIVRRRINSLAESRDRKSYDMTGWSRVFDTLANGVRNISTTMLLGGIGQVAKQAPAQMLTTVINVNDASITGTAAFEIKAALPVMQQFLIGERGEIAGGARWINQLDTGYSKLERYIESGLWSKVKDVAQNLGDVWLAALKKSDSVAAGHGWISYYKKYLKDNNIPFTNWDNEARLVAEGDRDRVQAGLYADTQIDIYQGASDPTKMATFAQRGKSGAENMMKTIFLPFSSFAIQERTRFLSDLRDATYGSTEEKKRAAKGLASTIAGIATFHWVRRYVLPFFFGYLAYGLYGMLGVEMEEPDEEKEKEMKDRTFKKFLGELAANITVGGYSSLAENAMIDAVNMMAYEYDKLNENENVMTEDGEIMSWETYQKKRAPFYRYTGPGADTSLGMFDVIPDQLKSVKDKLADLSDEELMDSLTEEEKRVLILAGFSDILYTLRLNDTDVARMINKMSKDVKTQAEEREKEQRKLMRMFQ